ncbi:MAG: TonB-dependent receptor [Gammaproteobacteria bacterium]|nr:TonB-dependent receptor [Gammaproteobacteria bacterium]
MLAVVVAVSIFGQSSVIAASNVNGTIVGTVNADGQALPGVSVTASNDATGFSRTLQADSDGTFRFSSMPIGEYIVSVTSSLGNASRSVNVSVGTTSSVTLIVDDAADLGSLTVVGQAISPIDITSTESATVLGEQTIDRIPVNRTVTDVALLAPGTTRGDSAFGNLASFGGSTVGENVCYINGLNVTDFRNGLGCSSVPFEFYQEFQIKTGGYSAEFGRATGGVINAVTKSGSNEYEYGFNIILNPDLVDSGLEGESQNSYFPDTGGLYIDRAEDRAEAVRMNLYASGPIVKDKAFFHVLYNVRDVESTDVSRSSESIIERSSDDAFWGLKLDLNITANHTVEFTAFSDESSTREDDFDADVSGLNDSGEPTTFSQYSRGDLSGTAFLDRGGENFVARYTGYLTPDFTISAMYGENEYDLTDRSSADTICPVIVDIRPGASNRFPGCWVNGVPAIASDKREAMRVDGEWIIDDHQLTFGLDNEINTSADTSFYSGGYFWLYEEDAGTEYMRLRILDRGGSFETNTSALYVEDTWTITDTVTLRLGVRNETFDNKNAAGESFIKVENQLAPRLGIAWDALGDGSLKVFANYGQYYLPVANNTNVRLAGAELFIQEYYEFGSIDPATGLPLTFIDGNGVTQTFDPTNLNRDPNASSITGAPVVTGAGLGRNVFGDGSAADTASIVDANIEPMYQEEWIVGAIRDLGNGWTIGARAVFRDLKSTLEDLTTDAAFQSLIDNGTLAATASCGIGDFHYVLANPGSGVTIDWDGCGDIDGDGVDDGVQTYTFTADQLGYPESIRRYNAVEFLLERAWDGTWFLQGSYTWSQSYGNNEGYVRSDNGQDDAGLTTLYDFPGLLDNAYGRLPNDRTHAVKLFGAYQFAANWRVGANMLLESGRPINAFGVHPSDPFAQLYGAESFFQDGVPVQRGSRGRTPFKSQVDLSLDYDTVWGVADVNLGIDIFNVFDSNVPTEVNESAENDSGGVERRYLQPTAMQAPRSIRLRAQFDF